MHNRLVRLMLLLGAWHKTGESKMPERNKLAQINFITDDDTGMHHIGEVDGGFHTFELRDYIQQYGTTELLKQLSYMQYQVINMERSLRPEGECGAEQVTGSSA